jgi:hypothetical protein
MDDFVIGVLDILQSLQKMFTGITGNFHLKLAAVELK